MPVMAPRSSCQARSSSNSGRHHSCTVLMCGCCSSASGDSCHIFANAGLNRRAQPLLPNTATASARLSRVARCTRISASNCRDEIEALGRVVEQIGDAAFRIGRRDHAQRASVRQMPFVASGFGGAIGLVQARLPLAEIVLFRNLPRRAQLIEDRRIARAACRETPRPGSTGGDRIRCRMSAAAWSRTRPRRRTADRAFAGAHPPCATGSRAGSRLRWRRSRCRRCRSEARSPARRTSCARRESPPATAWRTPPARTAHAPFRCGPGCRADRDCG